MDELRADYAEQRFSPLKSINIDTVKSLGLALGTATSIPAAARKSTPPSWTA